jgi:hypothetical protein
VEAAKRWRTAQDYGDAALKRALFKANARRRKTSVTSPPATSPPAPARRWPVVSAIVLVLILSVSLVVLVEVIIGQTRPLPAPPGQAALFVELPAQITDPQTLISFSPASYPWYYTSVAFDAKDLETRAAQTGSVIGSNSEFDAQPVVNSQGKAANIGGWAQPGTWKVLIQVTGKGVLPHLSFNPGNQQLLYVITINDNGRGLISHFLTDTNPGCGPSSMVSSLNNSLQGGQQIQLGWIYPCMGATGECPSGVSKEQWCIAGEAVLSYPVESEATGHVAGMLPVIDVGYREGNGANLRPAPYHVIVAGDQYTPDGTLIPGLQDVATSPSASSADSLSWQEDGYLRASWSWTVIADVDRSEQISDICLVLVGVLSSALVATLGYLIKSFITRKRRAFRWVTG